MTLETDVWFEVGNRGYILFTMGDLVIGAIRKSDFCVVIDHDDEVLRKFRKGIVALYRELPDLEQEVMRRISEVKLTDAQRGPVSRFVRALMPLSNLDFESDYFDQPEVNPSGNTGYKGRHRKRSKVLCQDAEHSAKVIPFPGLLEEEG